MPQYPRSVGGLSSPFTKTGNEIKPATPGNTLEETPIGQVTPAAISGTTGNFSDNIDIANDKWHRGTNHAGDKYINITKVTEDDEILVGATLVTGPIDAPKDCGPLSLFNMPVSSDSDAGDEMSATLKIGDDNVFTFGAFADSEGGIKGRFVKMHGAIMKTRNPETFDYNPSILTSDYLITVDNSSAARGVIISTEDVQSGSVQYPRFFIVKDEHNISGTHLITVSLESGTIDGNVNHILNADGDAITLYVDGSNGFVV